MKKVIIIILLSLCICGCSETQEKADNVIKDQEYINNIVLDNEYVIVDVRSLDEYNEGHIKGAINIPYDTIDENIELDKNKIIFVYCRSGNRSNIAYTNLTSLGYKVYDLGAITEISLPLE